MLGHEGTSRPMMPRSSVAIRRPAMTPSTTGFLRGKAAASTTPQSADSERWTGIAAVSSGTRLRSPGRRIDPAASEASSGSRRVNSA